MKKKEKNPHFFFLFTFNLGKERALQGQIRKLIIGNQEFMDQNKI